MTIQQRIYTVEEFEEFLTQTENKDRLFELIDGEIVEQVPTETHGEIAGEFFVYLREFVRPRKLGRVTLEATHRIPEDKYNSRRPDVSFIAGKRPSVEEGAVLRMPDLAFEVKSPSQTYNEMREKAKYYIANGVRMAILAFPEKRMVEVYAPNVDVEILLEHETISGRDVLPGFTLAVRDIFKDPLEE